MYYLGLLRPTMYSALVASVNSVNTKKNKYLQLTKLRLAHNVQARKSH